jgi:hypothetical protein
MKFSFEVGDLEKHHVEFNFNQLCGTLLIRVDDKPVRRATRLLNEPIHEVFDFMIAAGFAAGFVRWLLVVAARRLNPLQGPAQRVNFTLIAGFLAFRQLDHFQHFFHLFQGLLE